MRKNITSDNLNCGWIGVLRQYLVGPTVRQTRTRPAPLERFWSGPCMQRLWCPLPATQIAPMDCGRLASLCLLHFRPTAYPMDVQTSLKFYFDLRQRIIITTQQKTRSEARRVPRFRMNECFSGAEMNAAMTFVIPFLLCSVLDIDILSHTRNG